MFFLQIPDFFTTISCVQYPSEKSINMALSAWKNKVLEGGSVPESVGHQYGFPWSDSSREKQSQMGWFLDSGLGFLQYSVFPPFFPRQQVCSGGPKLLCEVSVS